MTITTQLETPPLTTLAWRLSQFRLQSWFRKAVSAIGLRPHAQCRLAELTIPDTEIAKKVTKLVSEVSPDFLVNHSIRTYLFGAALGLRDGLKFDREVLYLGSVMHDLGLTTHCNGSQPFELEGAQRARAFLLERQYDAARADLVHEAIALHTSIGLAARNEPEIVLVQLGSSFDMVGLRLEDLASSTIKEILALYPRLDIKRQMISLAQQAVVGKPNCPLAGLMRLGFSRLVLSAPFAE
jgi:hypothetical protein